MAALSRIAMNSNIVPHPALAFNLRVENAKDLSAGNLIDLFAEAVTNGYSRAGLAGLVHQGRVRDFCTANDARRFVSACKGLAFADPAVAEVAEDDEGLFAEFELGSESPLAKAAEAMAGLLSFEKEDQSKGGRHKYWFFKSAWQIDTPFWDECFQGDDPALVIASELKLMFKEDCKAVRCPGPEIESMPRPRQEQEFGGDDKVVTAWILECCSQALATNKRAQPKISPANHRRCLIALTHLDRFFNGGLSWRDEDFVDIASCVDEWMISEFIGYWGSLIFDDLSEPKSYGNMDDYESTLSAQACFFADLILIYAGIDGDHSVPEAPRLSYIADEDMHNIFYNIRTLGREDLREKIGMAIIGARQSVFGGVLPFTIDDAPIDYVQIGKNEIHWLARICAFKPGLDTDEDNPFWVVPPGSEPRPTQIHSRRTDQRALGRFHAYRSALERNPISLYRILRLRNSWRTLGA